MAIPRLERKLIFDALDYIDKNGVPALNESTKYELKVGNMPGYPPKYVIAVARHLSDGSAINTDDFTAKQAKDFLQNMGFEIGMKQEKYILTISADKVVSTDDHFSMGSLFLGNNYEPCDVYFASGNENTRIEESMYDKRNITIRTMPLLVFQIFEKELSSLSEEERELFPICKYTTDSEVVRGIYSSISAFKSHRDTDYVVYHYGSGNSFVIYSGNCFSSIHFAQECLKRFGHQGDTFVMIYQGKNSNRKSGPIVNTPSSPVILNKYSEALMESKNIIFRGAPGTGKSYLAKEIAAGIVSNGAVVDFSLLTKEQKEQIEFVQFHPNYDYADFVEGLRPKLNDDGTMGFELRDGVFKAFVDRARRNYEDSRKSNATIAMELTVQQRMADFFAEVEFGKEVFETINGNKFYILNVDEKHIYISIPGNETVNRLSLNIDEIRKLLESGKQFEKIKDITSFFGKRFATQAYSYDFALYKEINAREDFSIDQVPVVEQKKYVFIIDEINRGEISKIFGELFYSIDPGYRGVKGEISTQYANMHSDLDERFYIPENVYIIGTMNDIDRSVDSFDFAMRRRFRFIELKVDDCINMLSELDDDIRRSAIERMTSLNEQIQSVPDLNRNYLIGPAYFLKLKSLSFDQLWTDYLEPLLQEYVQGMYDEDDLMKNFAKAYGYSKNDIGDENESSQNQG